MNGNRYELNYDQSGNRGRIEVFNEADTCIASRTVHSRTEVASVLRDFQPILNLPPEKITSIIDSFRAMGLP